MYRVFLERLFITTFVLTLPARTNHKSKTLIRQAPLHNFWVKDTRHTFYYQKVVFQHAYVIVAICNS